MKAKVRYFVQILIILITVLSVGYMFFISGSGNMRVNRGVIFRYFTVDSNILCALSCIPPLFFREKPSSKSIMLFRYAGTTSVAVTMMTVLLFLGPVYGYASMFSRWNLWLHLLGPVLAIVSFIWLEREEASLEKRDILLGILPVIVYGVVYYIMVILIGQEKGGWPDFYRFNAMGRWYLSFGAMMLGTTFIALILRGLKIRFAVRKKAITTIEK